MSADTKGVQGIVLSAHRPGLYAIVFSNGDSYAHIPESWHADFEKFAADFRQMCQRPSVSHAPAGRSHSTAGLLGKAIVKGIIGGLVNANNNNNGGGGQYFASPGVNTGAGSFDMSSFWQPIQSAASDPIQ